MVCCVNCAHTCAEHLNETDGYDFRTYLSMGECDGSLAPDEMFLEAMRAIFVEGKHCHRWEGCSCPRWPKCQLCLECCSTTLHARLAQERPPKRGPGEGGYQAKMPPSWMAPLAHNDTQVSSKSP